MSTFLERYRNGEYEQVWDELIALGEDVRHPPLYEDALAVARETMARTRRNVETLYDRLKRIGYAFVAEPAENQEPEADPLDQLREQLAQLPEQNTLFGDMLRGIESFREQVAQLRAAHPERSPRPKSRVVVPPPDDVNHHIAAFEAMIGALPLSVHAWGEIVGDVNFMGKHPGLASIEDRPSSVFDVRANIRQMLRQDPEFLAFIQNTSDEELDAMRRQQGPLMNFSMHFIRQIREEIEAGEIFETNPTPKDKPPKWYSDPLCFHINLDEDWAHVLIEHRLDNPPEEIEYADKYEMIVGPDQTQKAGFSGGAYAIFLPDVCADTKLHGTDFYFVAYLRDSLQWGGFPDLKYADARDNELIAYLKEGLEPI